MRLLDKILGRAVVAASHPAAPPPPPVAAAAAGGVEGCSGAACDVLYASGETI